MAAIAATDEFVIGEKFSSYDELNAKIKTYQGNRFVQLAKRDSRTLEMAKRRVPKRIEVANPSLVYYTVHFACVFGGKKYKSEGKGQRYKQRYDQ